jgi:hypothetical protein
MENAGRAWRLAIGEGNEYALLDEAQIAQMLEGERVDLVDVVRSGHDFILAMGDCSTCTGPCHLWFMSDSESPATVCPHLIYFADFGRDKAQKTAIF